MRLYYAFVTLTAGYVGVTMYQVENEVVFLNKIIVLTIMFIGWGVNQIINDYMGLKEDKINAPKRPMVSGKLLKAPSLILSASVILTAIIWSLIQNPLSVIALIFGVVMNIIYSYLKGFGILGNLSFGLSISSCIIYSYIVLGGSFHDFFTKYLNIWIIVIILNMIMTYFTYFKDYIGDKETHKNTLVVLWGLKKASNMGVIFSFIPLLIFACLYNKNIYFLISSLLASILFILTGILFKKENSGKNTYFNLKYNFAALSASQASLVCYISSKNLTSSYNFQNLEGLILTIVSILSVITIFNLGYKCEEE